MKVNCNVIKCENNNDGKCTLDELTLEYDEPEYLSNRCDLDSFECKSGRILTEEEFTIKNLRQEVKDLKNRIKSLEFARKRTVTIPDSVFEDD